MREYRVKPVHALARGLKVLRVLHQTRVASLHDLLLATGIPKRDACSYYSPVTPAMKSKGRSMRFVARIIPRRAQWEHDPHSAGAVYALRPRSRHVTSKSWRRPSAR